jgi:hypothetical protein
MLTPPNDSAPKQPLSLTEKAALQAFKEERESGSRLIRKGEAGRSKKRSRKAKPAKPKPSVIRSAPSRPTQGLTEIDQAQRHARSRKVTVEFAPKGRSKPG